MFRVFLRKYDLKTYIAALNTVFFLFDLFYLVTWDDLDLYYGHKAQEMILTDPVSKSQKFLLWPDLWRHQWPPRQFFTLYG